MISEKRGILRSTFSISLFTMLSRILGYFRDMLQAYYLGAGFYSDAFTIAYRIPNLLRRVLGEGAMSAGFIPVFTEVKRKKEWKTWKLANTFFWDMVIIGGIVTILGIVFSPTIVKIIAGGFANIPGKVELTIFLNRIIFPFIFFISLTSIAMSILNSLGKFALPSATPIFYNFTIICLVLIFGRMVRNQAFIFALGVTLGGLIQFLSQVPSLIKEGMDFKPSISFKDEDIKKIGNLIIPIIIGSSAVQIQVLIGSYIASSLLPQGSVSYLYYSHRVMELTLGIFSVALATVLLPLLSRQASDGEIDEMKNTLRFSTKLTAFVTFPATIGLIVLSIPIINVLFERGAFNSLSTKKTAFALCFYSLGLPFFSIVKIFLQAFFSLKNTATAVKIGMFSIFIDILCSLIFIKFLSHGGIALALTIAGAVNLLFLWIYLKKKIGKIFSAEVGKDIAKIAINSLIMGLALHFTKEIFNFQSYRFTLRAGILLFFIFEGILIYTIPSAIIFKKSIIETFKILRGSR
ncbi:MAG: murein biosynthesis integral membrane protein MurJ [Candidatus Aminicenantia bacterium]